MLNFITLLHVSRPRYCVHKGVSGSGGRPRRSRRLPPASGPPGQERELFGITAAAGSPVTASALPRRARGLGGERDEGQRGEVVAERWVQPLCRRDTPALAGKPLSTGGITSPSSGATARPGHRGIQGGACGVQPGQRLARKGARWLGKEQRSPCKKTDAKRGLGQWCNRPEGGQRGGAAMGLRRGHLRAAWGAAAERGGGKWVAAPVRLCRRAGGGCAGACLGAGSRWPLRTAGGRAAGW